MDETDQMERAYPESLLPVAGEHGYVREVDLSAVYPGRKYFTQRRACCTEGDRVRMGEVTVKALYNEDANDEKKGSDLIGCSVNMMGTPHLPEYGKWHQKNPGSKPWDGKDVDIENFKGSYDFDENQTFVYINASLLEGEDFPFNRRMARDVFEKYSNVPEIYERAYSNATDYQIKGRIRHFHAPSFLNYWHAEIWIIDEYLQEKVKYIRGGKEWKEKIQRQLVERLRASAVPELPLGYDQIAPSVYMKV